MTARLIATACSGQNSCPALYRLPDGTLLAVGVPATDAQTAQLPDGAVGDGEAVLALPGVNLPEERS